jgi:leader peptidase (prepilin peptidase)/N-methyltransferase
MALVYAFFLAMLIASTFIDIEHFIIPDELTIGGAVAGFIASVFVPSLHDVRSFGPAMGRSLLGIVVGAGVVYAIVQIGKLLFGRQRVALPPETRVVFGETSVQLPDKEVPYEEVFYRPSDTVRLHARTVELIDRCYRDVDVRLNRDALEIGPDKFNPEQVPHMEVVSSEIVLPREAMGLGDVKFMAAIGAVLGWQATVFSLMVSSLIGSVVGITLILMGRREWSSRLPYGPYIAAAAVLWLFGGKRLVAWWLGGE